MFHAASPRAILGFLFAAAAGKHRFLHLPDTLIHRLLFSILATATVVTQCASGMIPTPWHDPIIALHLTIALIALSISGPLFLAVCSIVTGSYLYSLFLASLAIPFVNSIHWVVAGLNLVILLSATDRMIRLYRKLPPEVRSSHYDPMGDR